MRRATSTHGITLAVHDLGGTGVPLLLCHATGFCGLVWRPLARHLEGFHCWAPDLRGHGDSPAPDDHRFDWEGFADDVLAVVDDLGIRGCVAAGHSKGGAALLLAEQRRPGTFRALWVYEPVVFPTPEEHEIEALAKVLTENPLAAGARRRRARFTDRAEAFVNFSSKPPLSALSTEALDAYLDGAFREEADGSLHLKCPPEHEARVYEMGGRHGAFGRLGEIGCPVTVARGALVPGPSMVADAIVAALPHGRLEAHSHLGHFGPLEAPAEMADAVQAALAL